MQRFTINKETRYICRQGPSNAPNQSEAVPTTKAIQLEMQADEYGQYQIQYENGKTLTLMRHENSAKFGPVGELKRDPTNPSKVTFIKNTSYLKPIWHVKNGLQEFIDVPTNKEPEAADQSKPESEAKSKDQPWQKSRLEVPDIVTNAIPEPVFDKENQSYSYVVRTNTDTPTFQYESGGAVYTAEFAGTAEGQTEYRTIKRDNDVITIERSAQNEFTITLKADEVKWRTIETEDTAVTMFRKPTMDAIDLEYEFVEARLDNVIELSNNMQKVVRYLQVNNASPQTLQKIQTLYQRYYDNADSLKKSMMNDLGMSAAMNPVNTKEIVKLIGKMTSMNASLKGRLKDLSAAKMEAMENMPDEIPEEDVDMDEIA